MHILHLLNDIRDLGNGIINVAVDLACAQARQGHQVAVASAGGNFEALLQRYQVQHFTLDQRRTPQQLWRAIRTLHRIIQVFAPQVVHAHMITGFVLARLLRGCCSPYTLIASVHNEWQSTAHWMGQADRVIAVSQAVAQSMLQRGIPMAKLRVVPNGCLGTPRRLALATLEPLPLERPAITTIAGLYNRKGIAELIEAFVRIADDQPTVHLYLIGQGPDRANFEHQARASPVADRIHFVGFDPQPQRYLLSSDVFVLASHQEPFGLVLAEAREAGCAIVATHVDGIPEVLEGGSAGILVPPRDLSALAAALSHLIRSHESRQIWQHQARQNLDWLRLERMHQDTLAVYQDAIANIPTVCA